jgi:ATP-binding cassette subfamily C protein/ATP-binding cassette subfamily C protein LapB
MTERAAVSSQLARLRQFDTVRNFFAGQGALALLDLPFVFVFLLVMGSISGPIVLVPVIMLIAYAVFAAVWLPILNEQVAAAGTAKTLRTRRLMDTLTGMRELKALGAEAPWRDTCHEAVSTSVMEDYRTAHAHVIVNTVSQSAQTIAAVAVLGLGAQAVMQGDMTVGMLIAVMTLLWRVLAPLQTLFLTYVNFDQTAQVVRQMNQLMRLDTEHRSPRASLLIPKLKGAIRFERASFRYGPDADPALLGASFNIEPGEFVVIIGGNGCGKSTILKLAMGLYHPQAGAVSIDKLDLRQFNASDLHRGVAYVPQQPKLFYGTVAQNLRLADPGATIKQLEEACEMAGILQIIRDDLPQGFDTKIGDHETNRLQSGLVHGICMARAFLRDAPILLLDEPGSSLDEAADQRLVSRLRALHGSRTIVMVSHRPSHIRLADKVITMDRGMITSIGTPEEALAAYFKS